MLLRLHEGHKILVCNNGTTGPTKSENEEQSQLFRKLHYGVDIIPAVNLPMPEIVSDKKVQRS